MNNIIKIKKRLRVLEKEEPTMLGFPQKQHSKEWLKKRNALFLEIGEAFRTLAREQEFEIGYYESHHIYIDCYKNAFNKGMWGITTEWLRNYEQTDKGIEDHTQEYILQAMDLESLESLVLKPDKSNWYKVTLVFDGKGGVKQKGR